MHPRIYTYKITFEEVSYYYYGVKKETYFDQEYFGTPITHKWIWDFYTPKKQILEIFDYTDKGWIEAQEVEKRLIKPVYNIDEWCLNESCGGKISLEINRKVGKINGINAFKNKIGIFGRSQEKIKLDCIKGGKVSGERLYESGKGIFGLSQKQIIENAKRGGIITGKKSMELGIGIHKLTKDQRIENGKIYGKLGGQVIAEKKSRDFSLISPEGEIINAKNLTKFCRDNNLRRSNIQAVLRGERNHHKGWRRAYAT
jgi:hypothetical protein